MVRLVLCSRVASNYLNTVQRINAAFDALRAASAA